MKISDSHKLFLDSIDEYKEYMQTSAFKKRMKNRAIRSKEVIRKIKFRKNKLWKQI